MGEDGVLIGEDGVPDYLMGENGVPTLVTKNRRDM